MFLRDFYSYVSVGSKILENVYGKQEKQPSPGISVHDNILASSDFIWNFLSVFFNSFQVLSASKIEKKK